METEQYLELVLALVILVAITFYSFLENALSRMSRVDIKLLQDREKEHSSSWIISHLADGKYRVLIPLQFFLQVLLIVLGLLLYIMATALGIKYSFLISVCVMGALVLILRHYLPWILSKSDPEKIFLRGLPFFRPLYTILSVFCYPVIFFLGGRQNGDQEPENTDEEISEEEVQAYLDVGEEDGIFEQEESRMIQQVVEFVDTFVKEIVVPRTDIVAIPHTATKEELKNLMVQSRHSRIPVFKDNIDSIVGIVYVRHLLTKYSPQQLSEPIDDVVRPALFIPETKKILDLLREMQTEGEQMAVVVDEYGGVTGLVTLEDLLEEIVGEIRDEDQPEEIDIQDEGENSYLMNGDTELDDIEEKLDISLDEEGYNTIAGIIIKYLGRFPHKDEIISIQGLEIQVLDVDNRRVRRVRVRKTLPPFSEIE